MSAVTEWFSNCKPVRVGEYQACTTKSAFMTRRYWDGSNWSRSYQPWFTRAAVDATILIPEAAHIQNLIVWRGLKEDPTPKWSNITGSGK